MFLVSHFPLFSRHHFSLSKFRQSKAKKNKANQNSLSLSFFLCRCSLKLVTCQCDSPRLGRVRLRLFHLMANNPSKATNDDFLEQILGLPSFASVEAGLTGADGGLGDSRTDPLLMMLQLSSGDLGDGGGGSGGFHGQVFPLGLSLEQRKEGFLKPEEASSNGKRFQDDVVNGRALSMKNVSRKLFLYSLWLVRKWQNLKQNDSFF